MAALTRLLPIVLGGDSDPPIRPQSLTEGPLRWAGLGRQDYGGEIFLGAASLGGSGLQVRGSLPNAGPLSF